MLRYRIVAARDGDVVNSVASWPDLQIAEAWAAGLLVIAFSLDPETFDSLEQIAPETDGCHLEELEDDAIALASVELLTSLHPIFAKQATTPLLQSDLNSLAMFRRMATLAQLLLENGYRRSA